MKIFTARCTLTFTLDCPPFEAATHLHAEKQFLRLVKTKSYQQFLIDLLQDTDLQDIKLLTTHEHKPAQRQSFKQHAQSYRKIKE